MLKCPDLTQFALSPPLLSPHTGCREIGASPQLLPVPVQQYGRAGYHGLWLYSTMDQHKTNPFDTLLVKLLFIAQFLKSQWRTSDSWKGLLGGAEFQKSLSSLSLQEHRISCWKLQKQAPRNPSCISKPLPNFKQNPDINHRFLET